MATSPHFWGPEDQQATRALHMAETTGRLVGSAARIEEIERRSGRRKRG